MRNKSLIFLFIFIFAVVVVGCNNATKEMQVDKNIISEEGKEAKNKIISRVNNLLETTKDTINQVGYLESNAFIIFKNEINLIYYAIDSESRLEMNDDDEINNVFNTLGEKIETLTSDQVIKAENVLNSQSEIYQIVFKEDLNKVMDYADFANSDDGVLNYLVNNTSENASGEAMLENVESSISMPELIVLNSLEALIQETNKYGSQFSKQARIILSNY